MLRVVAFLSVIIPTGIIRHTHTQKLMFRGYIWIFLIRENKQNTRYYTCMLRAVNVRINTLIGCPVFGHRASSK